MDLYTVLLLQGDRFGFAELIDVHVDGFGQDPVVLDGDFYAFDFDFIFFGFVLLDDVFVVPGDFGQHSTLHNVLVQVLAGVDELLPDRLLPPVGLQLIDRPDVLVLGLKRREEFDQSDDVLRPIDGDSDRVNQDF